VSEINKSNSLLGIISDIFIVIIWGILFIIFGVMVIFSVDIVTALSYFLFGGLMIEIEIILLCGIVSIIIGIIILAWGLIKTLISPKKYRGYIEEKKTFEEKQDYMNPSWLKHQYYDLGRSLQDIANEQRVSMITIRKWVDKLGLVPEDLGTSE